MADSIPEVIGLRLATVLYPCHCEFEVRHHTSLVIHVAYFDWQLFVTSFLLGFSPGHSSKGPTQPILSNSAEDREHSQFFVVI